MQSNNPLVNYALSFQDKLKYSQQYRYSENYADCSSFVERVHKNFGITGIGGYTEAQWTNSKYPKVAKSDLQPGDVIYFKNTYSSGYTDGVSHTGIYIGNGKFVHCSSSYNNVVVANLNTSYWQAHYLGAKNFGGRKFNSASYYVEQNTIHTNSDTGELEKLADSINPFTYLKNAIQDSIEPILVSVVCIALIVGGVVFVGATVQTM